MFLEVVAIGLPAAAQWPAEDCSDQACTRPFRTGDRVLVESDAVDDADVTAVGVRFWYRHETCRPVMLPEAGDVAGGAPGGARAAS